MTDNEQEMPPRNLLICFDAFGTLFKPRFPIAQQYGDAARSFGLSGFTNDDVDKAFKTALKQEAKQNPNYGRAHGMNPEKWWTSSIPNGMVLKLLQRFWCNEGYTLFSDVQPLISRLRDTHKANDTRVVIGIITNSDDRVPDILRSFGLSVSRLRYGNHTTSALYSEREHDIDFSVISYDVGHEKPDKRIFQAAEEVLSRKTDDVVGWRKVYVGDEYDKDVVGALTAGWNAVLIDRESAGQRGDLKWLDNEPVGSLYEVFENAKAVGFSSLEKLSQWLPAKS